MSLQQEDSLNKCLSRGDTCSQEKGNLEEPALLVSVLQSSARVLETDGQVSEPARGDLLCDDECVSRIQIDWNN